MACEKYEAFQVFQPTADYSIWEKDPGSSRIWLLMRLYLLLELVTIAYTPVMFRLRSLKVGMIVGGELVQ
jgi:tryptophan-rich sensory protein